MNDDFRTDPKPPEVEIDRGLIGGLLLRHFIDEGDDDLVQAANDRRLSDIVEGADELGQVNVHVLFGNEEVAMTRFHWADLVPT